jgi:selenide,water dikinase
VLVGGGHSHVLLIRRWAMNPIPGTRLTLISSAVQTPYSGMLPGLIAGHYSVDEIHIDLLRLCAWANIRFIEQTVTGLDLNTKHVLFDKRPSIGFDILSLDTGSTPDLSVAGAAQFVTPVKPVSNFYQRWCSIRDRLASAKTDQLTVGVVGSGAGGFELVAAMRHALPNESAKCVWFLRNELPLQGRPARVGRLALEAAISNNIEVIKHCDIEKVNHQQLIAADGRTFAVDEILWCTAASGPGWLAEAGISVDKNGFVATNAKLQSVSHEFVFATGDVGTQMKTPSNKAGVFAVRQAPFLFDNIRRLLRGKPLSTYRPQRDFLSLMATGPKRAIASRGPVAIESDWIWRWKDWIDQRFMEQFRTLPETGMNANLRSMPGVQKFAELADQHARFDTGQPVQTTCRGCGAKVGDQILQFVLSKFEENEHLKQTRGVAAGLSPAEDTAVLRWPSKQLVQSVDQVNAIVDDPYTMGRIAALHALSDVVTLEADLHSAQIIATLPEASEHILQRDLELLMNGVVESLNHNNCALVGGHTAQGKELSIGLVVNASMNVAESRSIAAGDSLVLTQGLGIGALFAALMQQKARGEDIVAATSNMLVSNRRAAGILRDSNAICMTDVTGFGLLGHLDRLLNTLDLGAKLSVDKIPLLPGALSVSQAGVRSSLWQQNSKILKFVDIDSEIDPDLVALLCDPQTSGGLLAIVPSGRAVECVDILCAAGYPEAVVIGSLEADRGIRITA